MAQKNTTNEIKQNYNYERSFFNPSTLIWTEWTKWLYLIIESVNLKTKYLQIYQFLKIIAP